MCGVVLEREKCLWCRVIFRRCVSKSLSLSSLSLLSLFSLLSPLFSLLSLSLSLSLSFSVYTHTTCESLPLSLFGFFLFVYYETINEELNKRLIYERRCNERLKAKVEGSTYVTYNGLREGQEHLKIETEFINERFVGVMVECVILTSLEPQVIHRYSK